MSAQISGVSEQELVNYLKNRAIWLEPWEMIPEDSIPPVSLMTRIEGAMSRLDRFYTTDDHTVGLLAGDYVDLPMEFQRCKVAGAIGYGPSLDKRRANLDPDNYALEVMRSEYDRLYLPDSMAFCLKKASDRLLRNNLGLQGSPVFCAVFLDFDVHYEEQSKFINKLQHFIQKEIEVFIICDVPYISPQVARRFKHKFHQFTTAEFNALKSRIAENAIFNDLRSF